MRQNQRIAGLVGAVLLGAVLFGAFSLDQAAAQSVIDLAALGSSALSSHNTDRAIHHAPSMTYSAALADSAQRWADNIASTAALTHSGSQGVGENLYVSYTSESSVDARKLGADAVRDWYDEVKNYSYANPGFSANTGYFTQVVWKGSTQLGCGAAKGTATIKGTPYNAFYVVCQYSMPGNVQGAFQTNVQKP